MTSEPQPASQQREFKFLRCPQPVFHNAEHLQNALSDDAGAGWELVEKFDSKRVRMTRPVSARDHDESLDFDPYRTMTPSMVEEMKRLGNRNLTVAGVILVIIVIVFVIVFA